MAATIVLLRVQGFYKTEFFFSLEAIGVHIAELIVGANDGPYSAFGTILGCMGLVGAFGITVVCLSRFIEEDEGESKDAENDTEKAKNPT